VPHQDVNAGFFLSSFFLLFACFGFVRRTKYSAPLCEKLQWGLWCCPFLSGAPAEFFQIHSDFPPFWVIFFMRLHGFLFLGPPPCVTKTSAIMFCVAFLSSVLVTPALWGKNHVGSSESLILFPHSEAGSFSLKTPLLPSNFFADRSVTIWTCFFGRQEVVQETDPPTSYLLPFLPSVVLVFQPTPAHTKMGGNHFGFFFIPRPQVSPRPPRQVDLNSDNCSTRQGPLFSPTLIMQCMHLFQHMQSPFIDAVPIPGLTTRD